MMFSPTNRRLRASSSPLHCTSPMLAM
jgi:hypothetical protein